MKSEVYRYLVVLEPEADGAFSVMVPDLPGCVTWGENRDHALAMAKEAIALNIEHLVETGQTVPKPTHIADVVEISA